MIKRAKRISHEKPYYFAQKLQEVARLSEEGIPVINLGIGSPDLCPAPQVVETMKAAATQPRANAYQSYRGSIDLRTAYADWYRRWFNVAIDPESEVQPLMGSKEGIMHISMSFLDEGDQVLVPNPGYPAYASCTRMAGAESLLYDLNEKTNWLPDLNQLEKNHDLSKVKLMWVNYPHMPTGTKATMAFYIELIAWAKKNDILICSDNPYNFILNDAPISPLQVEGGMDHCIELVSLSKAYNMAGWRLGAVVGNQEYINAILTYKSQMDSGMYLPLQEAAASALRLDAEWFDELNATYTKRKKMVAKIADRIGLDYAEDGAGLFLWGKMRDGKNTAAERIDELLYGARVFVTPGHVFGSNGEGYIRISLCNPAEVIEEAYDRIDNYLKSVS